MGTSELHPHFVVVSGCRGGHGKVGEGCFYYCWPNCWMSP
jgi:hypothetical protein